MSDFRPMKLSEEEQKRLLAWWQTMESAKLVVQHLCSLVSELRLNPESSHADGMILFYRAVSEISYGYAGVRGGVRRALTTEYGDELQLNLVMCQSFAPKFSVDAKILLERIAKQISGESSLVIINQIRETLSENDIMLIELEKKAQEFFGKEAFDHINFTIIQDMSMY